MTLSHRLSASLYVAQIVALATLVRSIVCERWITVLASALLIAGAQAALRNRTWGLGLALVTAAAFPAAHLLGMAPAWFWFVGAAGAAPFALTTRPMVRFDRGATILFAVLAVSAGFTCAMAWRETAPMVGAFFRR